MMPLRGQASLAKMMPLGGKLTALEYHPTKYVNKAEKPTYLSTSIGIYSTELKRFGSDKRSSLLQKMVYNVGPVAKEYFKMSKVKIQN